MRLSTVAAILLAGSTIACAMPRQVSVSAPASFRIEASRDAAFDAAVRTLAAWNFIVAHTDRGSGVVATGERRVWWSDSLAARLTRSCDCGPVYASGLEEWRLQLSVTVTPDDAGGSVLRIQTSVLGVEIYSSNNEHVQPCTSRGELERAIARDIAEAVRRS